MQLTGNVGPQTLSDGPVNAPFRQGRSGDLVVSELSGRFFESNFRGTLFSDGMTTTSISNATFTTGTLGATCTPIVGLWNPSTTSSLVILQATLAVVITNATSTGPGAYVWASSLGNNGITTGSVPFNRKTGAASGSIAKGMSGVALTALTTTLVVRHGSALGGGNSGNFSFVGTAAGPPTTLAGFVENIDGAIIVPPGGVLALLSTTTAVAHSAASSILWAEVPYVA